MRGEKLRRRRWGDFLARMWKEGKMGWFFGAEKKEEKGFFRILIFFFTLSPLLPAPFDKKEEGDGQ